MDKTERTCSRCRQTKPITEFYYNKTPLYYCKSCERLRHNRIQKDQRQKKNAKRMCRDCGKLSPFKIRCDDCQIIHLERVKQNKINQIKRKNERQWLKRQKHCFTCGLPIERGNKKYRCPECYSKDIEKKKAQHSITNLAHIKIRNHSNKIKAIEYLGGKCHDCGLSNKNVTIYDLHHADPTQKEKKTKNRSNQWIFSKPWEIIQKELDKTVLLCANCHRIKHRTKLTTDEKLNKYNKNKARAIKHLGGKCHDCSVMIDHLSVYDFHHNDPTEKSSKVADLLNRTWGDKIEQELGKCILLCANCHRIRHHPPSEEDKLGVVETIG